MSLIDSLVWISHPDRGWVKARVLSEVDNLYKVQTEETKEEKMLKKEDLYSLNSTISDDMTALNNLNEPNIMENLAERYSKKDIYTYMGSALIAMNPFETISPPNISDYSSSSSSTSPHPYAIAENSYKNLLILNKSQSVIISGESGAGKTETAKIILQYLADRDAPNQQTINENDDQLLYLKLMKVSSILESFGNSKTSRNNNSSRFGKFMKLLFSAITTSSSLTSTLSRGKGKASNKKLELKGALIETYLLEKSRVISHNSDEQNFHIFYALMNNPPEAVLSLLSDQEKKMLQSVGNFTIAPIQHDELDESHSINSVSESFSALGMTNQEINSVWKIISALLFLGNIEFVPVDSPSGPIASIKNTELIHTISRLLGISSDELTKLLTRRLMVTRGETFEVNYNVLEAKYVRDGVIKSIYHSVFNQIVNVINKSILLDGIDTKSTDPSNGFIGVLDIFGFESFTINGFEQLLINYANESLQNIFNIQIFEREILLFEKERISIPSLNEIKLPNNYDCLSLLNDKSDSVFLKLDSISKQPKPSDERFCEELHKSFAKKNPKFGNVHRKDMRSQFIINHYAGPVKYTVGEIGATPSSDEGSSVWISKNIDNLPDGLASLLITSNESFCAELYAGAQSSNRKMNKPTTIEIFSKSMHSLATNLESTTCHFIRCIKPNLQLKPKLFDYPFVLSQVRASGVVQACEVLSVGLPTRILYSDLISMVKQLIIDNSSGNDPFISITPLIPDGKEVLLANAILKVLGLPTDSYFLGISMVFFRRGKLTDFQNLLQNVSSSSLDEFISNLEASVKKSIEDFNSIFGVISECDSMLENILLESEDLEKDLISLRTLFEDSTDQLDELCIPDNITNELSKLKIDINYSLNNQSKIEDFNLNILKLTESTSISTCDNDEAKSILANVESFNKKKTFLDSLFKPLKTYSNDLINLENSMNSMISSQFDSSSKIKSNIESCEKLFESYFDNLANIESNITDLKLNAERGDIDRAIELNNSISSYKNTLESYKTQFISTYESAYKAIESFQVQSPNEKFEQIEAQINLFKVQIHQAISESSSCINLYQGFIKSLENFKPPVKEPTPAPSPVASPVATPSSSPAPPTRSLPPPPSPLSATTMANPLTWKQLYDPKSDRFYYVNKDTMERTWKEPEEGYIPASTTSSKRDSIQSRMSMRLTSDHLSQNNDSLKEPLPPGWREVLDHNSNRYYYVNDETKERQWRKPMLSSSEKENYRASLRISDNNLQIQDFSNSMRQSVRFNDTGSLRSSLKMNNDPLGSGNRQSLRVTFNNPVTSGASSFINPVLGTGPRPPPPPPRTPSMNKKITQEDISESYINSWEKLNSKVLNTNINLEDLSSDCIHSVSYMRRLHLEKKTGYLMKQSKLLKTWKKRFFVFESNCLYYFDSEKDYLKNGKNGAQGIKSDKKFFFNRFTQAGFTSTPNCLSISNPNSIEDSESSNWILLAENESEIEEWLRFFNANIHFQYLDVKNLVNESFWSYSTPRLSIWKVPTEQEAYLLQDGNAPAVRKPIGIRTLPFSDSPRMLDGLYPGDIVEVHQIIERIEEDGYVQRYLRLANDKGWVFQYHPVDKYQLLYEVSNATIDGCSEESIEGYKLFKYDDSNLEDLQVFSHPDCSTPYLKNHISYPPGSLIQACAVWVVSSQIVCGVTEDDEDDDPFNLCFVKLLDGNGWVEMYHSVTGGRLLKPIAL